MTTHAEIDLSSEQALNAFRNAFQRHSAGVAIVTLNNVDGSPVGFTATSLASLSARPPMLTFNTATTASSWPGLRDTDHVAIHMLGVRNHKLATIMAGPAPQRFVGEHWHRGEYNLPVLDDVTAVLIAKIVARNEINQAASIVAEVIDGFQGQDDDGLLYRERRYLAPRPLESQD